MIAMLLFLFALGCACLFYWRAKVTFGVRYVPASAARLGLVKTVTLRKGPNSFRHAQAVTWVGENVRLSVLP